MMSSMISSLRSKASPRVIFITSGTFLLLLLWLSISKIRPVTKSFFQSNAPILSDIHNNTLGFERIFVINLPSRTDHRDADRLAGIFSNLKFEYVDGIDGDKVSEKAMPLGPNEDFSRGVKGSWRSHLDALARVVEENITSALILEDDVDWDVRLRLQLADFAIGVKLLSQPLFHGGFMDPSFPSPEGNRNVPSLPFEIPESRYVATDFVIPPHSSPYGSNWDVLWLGHCGARFPNAQNDPKSPRGRVLIHDDPTVPQTHYYDKGWGSDELITQYPNHTRVIHHTAENVCVLAYAVTQTAARQILYQTGLKGFDAPFDIMLRKYCDGHDDRPNRKCFTAQPAYFEHFRPRGYKSHFSDIANNPKEMNEHDYTLNIRVSTKANMERLTEGNPDLIDQYPDV